jgi:transcriptional regulator with XRE-family HTH domain
MSLHENLRTIRLTKGFSQEKMAEVLEYKSVNGYAKVERGETTPNVNKIKKMADILETTTEELISSNERNIFNITGNQITGNSHQSQSIVLLSETQCAHELEKAQLLLRERDKEIENLKMQILQLQEINDLLKKK